MWFLCSSVSWFLFASAALMGGDINEDRVSASTDFVSVRSGDVNALSLALATDALCKSPSIDSTIRQMHDLVLHSGYGIIISRRHYWESRHCRLQALTVKGCDETPSEGTIHQHLSPKREVHENCTRRIDRLRSIYLIICRHLIQD